MDKVKKGVMAPKCSKMETGMLASGTMTKLMAKVNSGTLMETSTKVTG